MFLIWLPLFLEISLADDFSLTTSHCPDELLSSHTGGIWLLTLAGVFGHQCISKEQMALLWLGEAEFWVKCFFRRWPKIWWGLGEMQNPIYNSLSSRRSHEILTETHTCVTFCTCLPWKENCFMKRSMKWMCVCPGTSQGIQFGVC